MQSPEHPTSWLDAEMQVPVSWYFEHSIYEAEQKRIFQNPVRYLGHESQFPSHGSYRVPEVFQGSKAIVRNRNEIRLISNICKHRHALMLSGTGQAEMISCPLHRWSYDFSGKLTHTPFSELPRGSFDLECDTLQNWNGFLFSGPVSIASLLDQIPGLSDLKNGRYRIRTSQTKTFDFNWKTYIDGFAEDYHVGPCHPGLGHLVDVRSLQWQIDERFSAQSFDLVERRRLENNTASSVYQDWQRLLIEHYGDRLPNLKMCWVLIYPNIMLEWHPGFLVASSINPTGPHSSLNVADFYHDSEILEKRPELAELAERAYAETADEDDEICRQIDRGLAMLYREKKNQQGPCQNQFEKGFFHFHRYLRKNILPPDVKTSGSPHFHSAT